MRYSFDFELHQALLEGKVEVKFSEPINEIGNIDQLVKTMNFTILGQPTWNFTWYLEGVTEDKMVIKINMTSPKLSEIKNVMSLS